MAQAATQERPDVMKAADAVRNEIRSIISSWSANNPERIIKTVHTSDIRRLDSHDTASRILILGQLENYTGAALPKDDPIRTLEDGPQMQPIEWPYELHPMIATGVIEVLLLKKELEAQPIRRLADEVAHQAQDYAQKVVVGEVFSFRLASCIIERIEAMRPLLRSNFRATLNRRFAAVGLVIQGGTVNSVLEIQKCR